jgi:hypothetical protein
VNHEAHERARRTRKGFVRFVFFRSLRVSKASLEQAFRVNLGDRTTEALRKASRGFNGDELHGGGACPV